MDIKTKLHWYKKIEKELVNRKIVAIRYTRQDENDELGWDSSALVIVLDNGHMIYPSMDDEGNGPGSMFTTFESLPVIPVL